MQEESERPKDSPWTQLCTCRPPFFQIPGSQRCWWLQSWKPFLEPPVETNWQMFSYTFIQVRMKHVEWDTCEVLTLKMSKEHCVRMVLKVEDKPSSTRLSKWVIFSVSVSSRVCSRVLLSISAKHLGRYKKILEFIYLIRHHFTQILRKCYGYEAWPNYGAFGQIATGQIPKLFFSPF